jgi:acetate kinase
MNILVLNCGSSSLKFQLIQADLATIASDSDRKLAHGLIERIGSQSLVTFEVGGQVTRNALPLRNHRDAIDYVLRWIVSDSSGIEGVRALCDIHAVGHRVVHGGEHFRSSVRIDPAVIKDIEDCIELAPLHNPANLSGIRAVEEILGAGIPQVAVFDTSFHTDMPETSYLYAIPYQYYRRYRVRRYGFHGTSHRYIAYRYRQLTGRKKEDTNVITLHLGNGCSACAIRQGRSHETSMGLTPLEGMVMGTRSGDIDPAIIDYLAGKEGLSLDALDLLLNKQSGLLGISGLTNDMRELLDEERENGDRRAKLAIDIFAKRVRKYLGAYLADMNGTDAIIFAGGIGENSADVRTRILAPMAWLGLKLDPARNESVTRGGEGLISAAGSRPEIWVIPTNEELLIARDTVRILSGKA